MAGVAFSTTAIPKIAWATTEILNVSLGTSLVWSAVVPPAFDAAGAGGSNAATGATTTATWSHTATAGATVLVDVAYNAASVSLISALTRSASYGGVAMTSLGSQAVANDGNSPYIETFVLTGVAGGAKTVSVSAGAGASIVRRIVGMSVSYTGAASVGTAQKTFGTGTAMSHAVTSDTGQLVHQAFCSVAAITAYSQTSRFNGLVTGGPTIQVGDAAGASTVTFSATRASSGTWASIAVPLIP